ncbi:thioredoxin family protein [Sneathiella litorea]|uniref:Thioredoxin family protein n=1 Tax=Sneathiella litorea TaxID=2606216 RepID=A0A6L8WAM1_9PROT|nr:thioredoxin family protein [Sneathiella litorea]MZR31490.1 thioredoxin family protein [Sneathiella litorea]
MKTIKVLGSGCSKCIQTAEKIKKAADGMGIAVEVNKETDAETIMNYGVMRTPAVVIDEALVHSGSVPAEADIRSWLAE